MSLTNVLQCKVVPRVSIQTRLSRHCKITRTDTLHRKKLFWQRALLDGEVQAPSGLSWVSQNKINPGFFMYDVWMSQKPRISIGSLVFGAESYRNTFSSEGTLISQK